MVGHRGRGSGRGRGRTSKQAGGHHHNQGNAAKPGTAQTFSGTSPDNQLMNADLSERFTKGKATNHKQAKHEWNSAQFSDLDVSLNVDIRKYMQQQNSLKPVDGKESWINFPEIPTQNEILLEDNVKVDVMPNRTTRPFKNIGRYLKTHYQLLREDALGPLRDAVDKFRQDTEMDDNSDVSIYEKVHICGFTFTNMGIAARVKFSTKRAGRKILWSASKRLVSGSLVALTPASDNFSHQCIVAIVAARPLDNLERSPPMVDIYFSSSETIQIDPQVSYIMVESKKGYFEAYRHTLKAMQKLSKESFPLSSHVVGADTDIGPPNYLMAQPTKTLLAAITDDEEGAQDFSSVDILNDWPQKPSNTTLDVTQWRALEQILTRKLAIIQGPPGTGKTHVSKIALQIFVQNHAHDDPPIIIAAQTNHALDQLLKHVSKFDPEYIRLGGRSTSSEVRKRALFEVRQTERIPPIPGSLFGPAKKKLEREYARFGEILSIFDGGSKPIPCSKLAQLGVITKAQEKSLTDAAYNWVTTDNIEQDPLQYWLHNALTPFEVIYEDDVFGFEDDEEDLEFEQLRETEAEHGVTDEEDIEMLKGPWQAVSDNWSVVVPSNDDLEKAKRMLDNKQDLWSIPEYLRGPAYFVMKTKAKEIALSKFRQAALEYNKLVEELKIGKWERDAVYLRRAKIIGMTTTGLSKYRPLIASLKPKVILIEEAAEVIEGPVTAAFMESLEHIILVGDHQQLQGHCSLQELEDDPFFLNVSTFERLVNMKMPYTTLLRQRRMSPEIRQLISSLYPDLEDHESILTRPSPPPWGTGLMRSCFFQHDWSELKDNSLSIYNEEEARMVAKFYRHLLRHGVPASAITVLTFYNGQRKRILRELRNDLETSGTYNNVKTVDSYQGEENDIVLLSLVRNNTQGQIGFLDNSNRVCVALSRAKYGFYLFGNSYLLSQIARYTKSELWSKVGAAMSESQPSRLVSQLPLECINHGRTVHVQWPEDFDQNDGGCDLWCGTELPCGHVCPKKCHATPHHAILCNARCEKRLSCGHLCLKECHELCYCDCEDFLLEMNLRPSPIGQSLDPALHADNDRRRGSPERREARNYGHSHNLPNNASQGLARGGAAFQQVATTPATKPGGTIQSTATTFANLVSRGTELKPDTWVAFASGGAKMDDMNREEARTPQRDSAAANLLDLSPPEDKASGVIESNTEEQVGERTKYTQMYRPAAPKGFGFSESKPRTETTGKKGASHVTNLMD